MSRSLEIEWLGRMAYPEALELQHETVQARRSGRVGDRLLLLEHPPVVTLGRGWREENLLVSRGELAERGIAVYEVARGGDVTYHAPGQLVGYLVMDLKARGEPDLHAYLRSLENALMGALGELGLATCRIEGKTGVFVDRAQTPVSPSAHTPMPKPASTPTPTPADTLERKLASIGVGVRGWITFHGFALNVTTDLGGFGVIVPCGLEGVEMTSVARELGRGPLGLDERVRDAVCGSFLRSFAR